MAKPDTPRSLSEKQARRLADAEFERMMREKEKKPRKSKKREGNKSGK